DVQPDDQLIDGYESAAVAVASADGTTGNHDRTVDAVGRDEDPVRRRGALGAGVEGIGAVGRDDVDRHRAAVEDGAVGDRIDGGQGQHQQLDRRAVHAGRATDRPEADENFFVDRRVCLTPDDRRERIEIDHVLGAGDDVAHVVQRGIERDLRTGRAADNAEL